MRFEHVISRSRNHGIVNAMRNMPVGTVLTLQHPNEFKMRYEKTHPDLVVVTEVPTLKPVEIIRVLNSILEEPVIKLVDDEIQAIKEAIEIVREQL